MPGADYVFLHAFPNYLCALIAPLISHIITGLGREVRKAREMGSYVLGDLIGAGGMGEVWQATHRFLARPAAIKLIKPEVLGAMTPAAGRRAGAAVPARGPGRGDAPLAPHHPPLRLRRHQRRHLLLRDGAAQRDGPADAGVAATVRCRRPARSTCCSRPASRWPRRTTGDWSTGTSSRPTSRCAGWGTTATG